jgi:hypothetical protein
VILLYNVLSYILHCKPEIIVTKQAADPTELLIELRTLESEVLLVYFVGLKAILIEVFLQIVFNPWCSLPEVN